MERYEEGTERGWREDGKGDEMRRWVSGRNTVVFYSSRNIESEK